MKVLIATEKPFAKEALEAIKQEITNGGHSVEVLEKYTEKSQLISAVAQANAIIIRSDIIDEEVLAAAKELKIVVRAGAGYDNVDIQCAKEHKIVVENTPGQNANAVAELVLGLLVYTVRNFYNGKSGSELKGKKLGLLAYGNVSRNVARIAYDAYCSPKQIEDDGVVAVNSPSELFTQCDIVSLHIPATPETTKSINYELVNKLPKHGILINTARKEVINEEELFNLMNERQDIKFITDIKPNADAMFSQLEGRYFSTPKKMGAQTSEANNNAGIAAAKQINAFFNEGITKYQVNK